MRFTYTLTGVKPLLMCNGRLANPLNPYTRELAKHTKKQRKTDEDHLQIMRIESRGACWETADGLLGIPADAIWRCCWDASKRFKLGTKIKEALTFDDPELVAPLLIDGKTVSCDDWIADFDHILYRSVVIGGRKVMRARPRIPVGWSTAFELDLDERVLDYERMTPVFSEMEMIGIGDWRPRYGKFTHEAKAE